MRSRGSPIPAHARRRAGTPLPSALLEGPDQLLSEALDVVAEARDAPGLLAAMSVAARQRPLAVGARVRLEGLDDAPPRLGRLTVEEAWQMDADEPVDGLFLLCAREGETGRQLFSFTIETPISWRRGQGWLRDRHDPGEAVREEAHRHVARGRQAAPHRARGCASKQVVAGAVQGARSGLSADGRRLWWH